MAEHPRQRRFARRAAAWSAGWLAAAAFYLLLIDTTDLPELLVAAGAAALAATGFELAREQQTVGGLRARMAWLARAHRPLQPANGVFRAVSFRCGPDQELEPGRCALAESLGSFSPNTIIVGVDVERELILGHQLRPGGGREAIDVLGLGDG
jgi:hypothetical protein